MQSLFVTHVSTFNNTYLKVHGQLDTSSIKVIKNAIESLINVATVKNAIPHLDQLAVGKFCLAQNDNNFLRARIVGILPKYNQLIVHYMDYGFDRKIDITDIRIVSNFPKELEDLPVQVTSIIVCGITNDWQPYQIEEITNEILWRQVETRCQMHFSGHYFADLIWKNKNLADFIIENRGYGKIIKLDQLRADIFKISKQKHSIFKASGAGVSNTFKGQTKSVMPARQLYSNSNTIAPATLSTGSKPVIGCLTSFRSLIQGIQNENIRVPYTGNPLYGNFGTTRLTIDNMSPPRNAVATFKSTTLMVGNMYDVECSFVDNGPCSFSVHLKTSTNYLSKMMNQLESVELKNIYEKPTLGMACIARFPLDNLCYRAVIMNIKLTGCQVSYVDYGNHEYVPYHDIFEIPSDFLEQKCFSIRFALSGYKDLEPINDNLKNMFKELALYKTFKLKVTPLEGPPLVQYCELYDENNQNILEILKQYKNRKQTYTSNETLDKTDIVIVCYIESPKKFFVQKLKNQNVFESMMDELFLYCNKNKSPLNNFTNGTPCAVKFENAWYRAEIIDEIDNNRRVTIRHIDFGNERKCDPNSLTEIAEQFTLYPPQAIQCCLKGFENSDLLTAETTITQFEMLAETSDGDRRKFKTNIFKMHTSNCYLLNLLDDTFQPELNLMKRLFKLNMPFNKYIGMEKENFNIVNNLISKSSTENLNNYSKTVNEKEKTQQINCETSSIGSSDNISTNNSYRRNGGDDGPQRRNSPQESGNRYQQKNMRDQNYGSGRFDKGIRNNLPPRFQNQRPQRDNNNRHSNNNINNSYEKQQNNSSETSGISSGQSAKTDSYNKNNESNWSVTSTTDNNEEEYIPMEQDLPKMKLNVLPSREEILICWWISPHQFYTHHINRTSTFEQMMREIQIFYKNKETIKLPINIGASVIARYRADNTLYRAKVLACNHALCKYKVEFVDFGNQSTVTNNDLWLIEKRFSNEPIMAKLCSFDNIISQFEHSYITNELEKYLKPGATVFCNFLREDNDLFYVDIELNNRSLKDILIEKGLISELKPGTLLEILVGQQIKGQIISVKDLLNFQILIEGCDVKLLCSYSDIKYVKANLHLSSEFKSLYEGKKCSFDVIELTVEKILMVKPIIPLFIKDIVEPVICNYPIISDVINVKISYVSSAHKLYANLISTENESDKLLDDLFNYYDQKGNTLTEIQLGLICAANSTDGNWYRAQIISSNSAPNITATSGTTTKNDSIEVYYFDYGNTEIIDNINKLKRLDDSFLTISALAIELYFPIKSINNNNTTEAITSNETNNVINRITTLSENYELQVKLFDQYENSWIIDDIRYGDISLKDILRNEGLIEAEDDIEFIKRLITHDNIIKRKYMINSETKTIKDDKIENIVSIISSIDINNEEYEKEQDLNKEIPTINSNTIIQTPSLFQIKLHKAYISHCDNPGRFFLQLASDINELDKMQDNIQIVASSLPPLMTTVPGAQCIALYAVDNTWYRARIIDSELMAVQFTDYGNTDVDIDPENIREMNEAFAKIKSFAIPCSLAAAPKQTTDWVDEANKLFLENLENMVDFEFISKGDSVKNEINYINLYIDNKNIIDYLCDQNLAKKLECIESGGQCFVSHLNNLSDFYLELEHDAQGLELIAEYLADFEKFPIIEKTMNNKNVGKICAAIFPDDNQWYRAKILTESSDGFEVLFIDFGNTVITYETREISDEISQVPFLSKKCSLRMPDYILGWSDEAEKKFTEISALGEQIFTVILKEPSNEYAIVDLFIDNKNLLEIIEPLCDHKPANLLNISTSTEISEIIKLNNTIKSITISHINTPGDFYIQFNSDTEILEKITNQLLNELNKKDNNLKNPTVGEICAAIFLDDGALYRAEILSINNNSYNVLFIDFGNCSETTDLRILPEDLLEIPPIAKNCSLFGTNLNNPVIIEKFNSIIDPIIDENFNMKIIDDSHDLWIVNLTYLNEDLSEKIKEFQLFDVNNESQNNINQDLKNVIISHIISSTEFYIQYESEAEKVELISNMLTNMDKLLPINEPPKIGEIYAAQFPDDECFYRAKIMNITDNEIQVFYIDFGNSSKTTELRLLPNDLKNLQYLAIKCELDNDLLNNNELLSKEIIDKIFVKLMDSHFGETLQMNITEKLNDENNNEYWKVKLFVKNSNLTIELEKLIKLNSNVDDNISAAPINNVKKCTISHCNSPNDFYIQLSSDTNELEEITKKLSEAELNFEKLPSSLSTNELCAAKFEDDGAFYRAKILSQTNNTENSNNSCEVLYIDFGNTAITNELRKLPDNLKHINSFAKHCALEDNIVPDIDFMCKNSIDCMQQMINSHLNETFQVDIINDSTDPWVVKLYYQNKNFADELCNTIKDTILRNDENIMWHNNSSSSASSSTIGITNDMINEITDNDQIISHEVIGSIVDNFDVTNNDKNCNTTQELAQELYNGFQEALSHPNIVKK